MSSVVSRGKLSIGLMVLLGVLTGCAGHPSIPDKAKFESRSDAEKQFLVQKVSEIKELGLIIGGEKVEMEMAAGLFRAAGAQDAAALVDDAISIQKRGDSEALWGTVGSLLIGGVVGYALVGGFGERSQPGGDTYGYIRSFGALMGATGGGLLGMFSIVGRQNMVYQPNSMKKLKLASVEYNRQLAKNLSLNSVPDSSFE